MRQLEIAAADAGQRLDNYLLRLLKGVPRSHVYRLLRTGQVRVNGKRVKPTTRVETGDRLRIPPVRVAQRDERVPAVAQMTRVEDAIIHQDQHFLVLDKPSGIASHGGSGVSHGVIELLRATRPKEQRLELVHRLDRDTSGVLVLARSRKALTGLQALIRENRVTKEYLCLLEGRPTRARFDVNAPLRKRLSSGERMMRVDDGGKPALTFFDQVQAYRSAALFKAKLETGRTHQIRAHAAHAGHPVAGDDKYSERASRKRFRALGLKRLFLHAARFEFEWGECSYSFSAPLPEDLKIVLDRLEAD